MRQQKEKDSKGDGFRNWLAGLQLHSYRTDVSV